MNLERGDERWTDKMKVYPACYGDRKTELEFELGASFLLN